MNIPTDIRTMAVTLCLAFGLAGYVGASELWWCDEAVPVSADGADFCRGEMAFYANKAARDSRTEKDAADVAKADAVRTGPTRVAHTSVAGYSNSARSFFVEMANLSDPGMTPYAGFSSSLAQGVVPEPTSGLLMLWGAMMLGLARKRGFLKGE